MSRSKSHPPNHSSEHGRSCAPSAASPWPAVIGQHLLIDLVGIEPALLTDERQLMQLLLESLQNAGFQVVGQVSHKFPGDNAGVTGVALLSESHAAFHTYPEFGYMALDLFTCGAPDPESVLAAVIQSLQPTQVRRRRQVRGAV